MIVKLVECLDWPAPNRPGELLHAVAAFAKAGVNLNALWAYTSHDNGPKLAAIAKQPARLKAALKKLGVRPHATQCFCVTGTDKAGVLVEVARKLADAQINVECLDALAGGGKFSAAFWVPAADLARAKKILKAR